MITIFQALQQASEELSWLDDIAPKLEAEVLLAAVLGATRSHLFAWPEQLLTAEQEQELQQLVKQRVQGEPIAYLTGRREFWSLDLELSAATLIPRPETELLVAWVLELIPVATPWRIADLGTGCGAIAAAVAVESPDCQLFSTDVSTEALAVAEANFARLGLDSICTLQGEWCAALPPEESYHLIVSNPPYIALDDPCMQRGDLSREPRQALVSGVDGLDDIRRIIEQAPEHLAINGWLLLEHGSGQGEAVRHLFNAAAFTHIETRLDLAGHERVTAGQRG